MSRELEWIRSSPKARQAKSKARITAYDKLAEEAGREEAGKASIQIAPGPRLGGMVVEVEGLSKAFGDRLLIDDLSFKLPPGGIVGVIGPNGAGKTTLFKMMTGLETARRRHDPARRYGQARLRRPEPRPPRRQEDRLGGNLRRPRQMKLGDKKEMPRRAYCGWFNFKGADQQKKVGLLSGGERNRVHLAKMLKEGGNLLLLDEPTNDLDTETLGALEAALEDFPRLRRGHLARPLLPRPPRDAHPRLRGRQPRRMVRRQLRRLRGGQEAPPRRSGRRAAPHQVQAVRAVRRADRAKRKGHVPFWSVAQSFALGIFG